jgi:hypothetical protein
LAELTGKNERSIRRALCLLEANHWIVRRYSASNRRSDGNAGIDLRPLAARLHELRQAAEFIEQKIESAREQAKAERDDLAMTNEPDDGAIESGVVDISVLLKSYKINPGSTNLVQGGATQATSGQRSCPTISSLAVDSEILFLMVQASPTLQKQLTAAELCDLMGPEPSSASVQAVATAVKSILSRHIKLRPAVWQVALAKHGWAALAAVMVAVERHGVRDPAGYLYAMLKSARLRDTVRHNLRAIEQQESGRA